MRDIDLNPWESEVASSNNIREADENKGDVVKTGTTTVGIRTEEGVVVATDRRASLGGRFVSSKNVVKVEEVHPTGVVTLVGSVGGAQQFNSQLSSEVSLYRARRQKTMSINALANFASNLARNGPFLRINPIVAGVDEDGTHVYSVDPAGGLIADDYTVNGSGMQVATGTIESGYNEDMNLEEVTRLAARSVESASERDTGSGNGLIIAQVTEDGVNIDEYKDYSVVDEL